MDIVKSTITMVGDIQVQKAVAKELDNEDPTNVEGILTANTIHVNNITLQDMMKDIPVVDQKELERVDENT